MAYDQDNIFAKILRREIPCDKVFEDDYVLAFRDIAPKAPVHVLVIPKGAYSDAHDFAQNARDEEILAFTRATGKIASEMGLINGHRLIANTGADACQEVPHYHLHLIGGKHLGGPF